MQEFEYFAARSVEQTVDLLQRYGEDARILSGGTDLIVQLREGRCQAKMVVDIKHIPETNVLSFNPADGLKIGAAVPCWRIAQHSGIRYAYPGLLEAVALIGGSQIQGRASLGGNLCNASPAADSIPALIVHQAVCVVSGPDGQREIQVEDFCLAPGRTALQPGEFLVSIHVPPAAKGFGAAYLRFTPRSEMDIAVVGAGAAVILSANGEDFISSRLALGAVAPRPLYVPEASDVINGKVVNAGVIELAAQAAGNVAQPITDMRGTAVQRRHLAIVLTRRAINLAVERATKTLQEESIHGQ